MNGERGLQAAVGVVMAFSILWTMAILVPDDSSSSASVASTQKFGGLVVDGKHYVLDTNVDQTKSDGVYKVIHAVKTPTNTKKSPKNIKRKLNDASNHVVTSESAESSLKSTEPASKENDDNEEITKPRMSSFSYVWFILFICYHARNVMKRKNRQVLRYGEEFFVKNEPDHKSEYGLGLEYEDDYSVDTSFYGSISKWNELQKFDLDDDPFADREFV